jgi:[protein-PII] uridylyltransferase
MAKHGYRLSFAAEDRIADALPILAVQMPEGPFLWNCLREVLLGPWAAHALRTMHALGILELIIPEFHGIESLVIRDTWHRYTVDEHTFHVIDNVHRLRQPQHEWEKRLAGCSLKSIASICSSSPCSCTTPARRAAAGNHASNSVELSESLFSRLELDAEERETVRRVIHNIWKCRPPCAATSSTRKRSRLRGKSRNPAAAQDAHLMTYADIRAVSPEALTPWKAESLWQLYMSASNFLDRSVDEIRYHASADPGLLQPHRRAHPRRHARRRIVAAGSHRRARSLPRRLAAALPQHSRAGADRNHFRMAMDLREDKVSSRTAPCASSTRSPWSPGTVPACLPIWPASSQRGA